MFSIEFKPLRYTIAGLCLFAGVTAAQAALTITFEEDAANGQTSIRFSGQIATPTGTTSPLTWDVSTFTSGIVAVSKADISNPSYFTSSTGWSLQAWLPVNNYYSNAVDSGGVGGFYFGDFGGGIDLLSATEASAGTPVVWDGFITYTGNLADIDLVDGQSGTIIFTKGGESISISWSAVVIPVPEPSTYALVLGLGIGAVALLRRRARG